MVPFFSRSSESTMAFCTSSGISAEVLRISSIRESDSEFIRFHRKVCRFECQRGVLRTFSIATGGKFRYIWPSYEWTWLAQSAQIAVSYCRRCVVGHGVFDFLAKQTADDTVGHVLLRRVCGAGRVALRDTVSGGIPRRDETDRSGPSYQRRAADREP